MPLGKVENRTLGNAIRSEYRPNQIVSSIFRAIRISLLEKAFVLVLNVLLGGALSGNPALQQHEESFFKCPMLLLGHTLGHLSNLVRDCEGGFA